MHLGGHLGAQTKEQGAGTDGAFGRKVRGLKVTADGLADYVERVVRRFDEQRGEGETFAQWTVRAGEADLS